MNSFASENMLKIHKPKCENNDITTIRTSPESQLHWKKHFQKNLIFFRLYADFEADNEGEKSSIGNKITNSYKQIPACDGYKIICELEDVLKSGCYKSPLEYEKV